MNTCPLSHTLYLTIYHTPLSHLFDTPKYFSCRMPRGFSARMQTTPMLWHEMILEYRIILYYTHKRTLCSTNCGPILFSLNWCNESLNLIQRQFLHFCINFDRHFDINVLKLAPKIKFKHMIFCRVRNI